MCSIGDIIIVEEPVRDGQVIGRHSFVVVSMTEGKIEGLDFNMVGNIMGSFDNKSDSYKRMKLSYPENYEISPTDVTVPNGNSKAGYVKAGVLFYFDTDKLNYQVIGHVNVSVFNNLIHYIENLSSVEHVIDNLKEE